ncbi:Uncharacterized protein Adt_31959 [Abeliophyllum distichum]|uniref:Transposase MuDR plant domain-containing protein n=1 Tax=Abeliophyllum distichum TaxID=126358 RepID=A0ABD1RFK3_9LAMI
MTDYEEDSGFIDSENEHDDDDILYEQNVTHDIENEGEERVFEGAEEVDNEVDDLDYPSTEELHIDYASNEEVGYRFPKFIAKIDMQNPKFVVGYKFRCIEEFRQSMRNYWVVNRYNVKFKTNYEIRVQGICKLGCQWKI